MQITTNGTTVPDVFVGDIALVELARGGSTSAPADVMSELSRRGHVTVSGQAATLTAAGKARADLLSGAEDTLRAMCASGRGPMLRG